MFGAISAATGIAGLVLGAPGFGAPLGLALEAASLASGGLAIGADCAGWFGTKPDTTAFALDTAAEATAGVGGVVKGLAIGSRTADAFDAGLTTAHSVSAGVEGADEATSIDGLAVELGTGIVAGASGVAGLEWAQRCEPE